MSAKYLIVVSCLAILLTGCYPYQRVKNCTSNPCGKRPAGVYCADNHCSKYTFVSDNYFQADANVPPPPRPRHKNYKGEGYKGERFKSW